MVVVVPGGGHSVFEEALASVTVYRVIGPFGPGIYLDRISGLLHTDSGAVERTISLGFVLGGSLVGAASAFTAGQSLIQRSTVSGDGKPLLRWNLGATTLVPFELHLGVETREGANALIVRLAGSDPDATTDVLLSLRTFRILRLSEKARDAGAGPR